MGAAIDRLLTPARLREVVRTNLRMGITKEAISLLILNYVPLEARTERAEGGVSRQAIENIPPERRGEFLRDLVQMAEERAIRSGSRRW